MTNKKITIKTGWNLENTYATLPEIMFTIKEPTPVDDPKLIILNKDLAASLGLNIEELQSKEGIEILAGNKIAKGGLAITQAYAGHQFGHFTMLGDGRAMMVGEQITPEGERFDIQLKGSGRTVYSRGGDGRAALGPMLREYIISEAMHGLDIPTTRSLAVVLTGEPVIRVMVQKGAIMTRVASSHIRVGTFEYVSKFGSVQELLILAEYTLERHFKGAENHENRYLFLLQEVIKRQAELIAKWQLVGFIHGVMNTDNMSICGETIDYGPCAFMDAYNIETVFSSIDKEGRYAYGNQPNMAAWNLARFAETLLPLIHENMDEAVKLAQKEISNFEELYYDNWILGMRKKLGIFNKEKEDESLIKDLLSMMQKYGADYTNTFRDLTLNKLDFTPMFASEEFTKWYKLWNDRLERQNETKEESYNLMKNCNPAVIPRNHIVEEVLKMAEKDGDYSKVEEFVEIISNPYDYSISHDDFYIKPLNSSMPYRTYCGT